MSGLELRAYGLSAVLSVLLGIGIGFGWHYFVDSAGVTAMASVATPAVQHDAPNPPANPPSRGEGAGLSVPRSPGSPDVQQTTPSRAVDLSDEERLTLGALLTRAITNDRYPSSLRARTLKDILTKLVAKSPVQPDPAPKPRRARGYSVGGG
jgi:hypothetical protein